MIYVHLMTGLNHVFEMTEHYNLHCSSAIIVKKNDVLPQSNHDLCIKIDAVYSDFTLFFFYRYGDHRDLHSFPTRRSSDLTASISKESPAITGVVEMVIRRPI